MQDLDDFFTDDIVFDDQTLALLDEQEQKFISQREASVTEDPPPTKRQKTTNGWSSGRIGVGFVDDLEDLPEISVQSDGTYGLHENGSLAKSRNPLAARPSGKPLAIAVAPQLPVRRAPPPAITHVPPNRPPLLQRQGTRPAVHHIQQPRIVQQNPTAENPSLADKGFNSHGDKVQVGELNRQVEEVCLPSFTSSNKLTSYNNTAS